MSGEADGAGEGFAPFNTLGGWSVRKNVQLAEGSTPLTELNVWIIDIRDDESEQLCLLQNHRARDGIGGVAQITTDIQYSFTRFSTNFVAS